MSKKKFSGALIASILFHTFLLLYVGSYVLDKTLPQGEVSTVQFNYNAPKGAPLPTEVDVVDKKPEPIKPEPKKAVLPKALPIVKTKKQAAPPKEVVKQETKQEVKEEAVEDKQGEVPTETQPQEPTTPPVAVEKVTEKIPEKEPEPVASPEPPAPPVSNATATNVTNVANTNEGAPTGPVQSDAVLTPMPGNKKIEYPYWSRLRKQEGVTVVHYVVSSDGTVKKVDVVKSSGAPGLDHEVVNKVKDWKFRPMGREGVYERPVQFSLKGDALAAPSKLRTTN